MNEITIYTQAQLLAVKEYRGERETKALPRMRTLPQAVKEMREADPGTYLNITALRRWVKAGLVPTVQPGKSPLVNMDTLERFMEGGGPDGKH